MRSGRDGREAAGNDHVRKVDKVKSEEVNDEDDGGEKT